jgi:hypothetical protein
MMDNERDHMMIVCRAADARVLADVLTDARRRSVAAETDAWAKGESSTVAIIDDVLRRLERPVPLPPLARPVVLVVRDPDYQNEFVLDGEVETIDVDLGSGFDGPKGFANLKPAEREDWTRSILADVAHLPAESKVRQAVEQLVAEMAG